MTSLLRDVRETVRLATPLVVVQVAVVAMSLVDTALVGRYDGGELGAVALGGTISFTVMCLGMGFSLVLDPLVSQCLGAGEPQRAWAWFRIGVRAAALAGVPVALLSILVGASLCSFGVAPDLRDATLRYLWGRAPALVFFLVYLAGKSYLQCFDKVRPLIVAALVANVFNFVADVVLIYGDAVLVGYGLPAVGLPPMGGLGAAISTTISSAVMVAVLWPAVRDLRPEGPVPARLAGVTASRVIRLGLPIGLQHVAEGGVFTIVAILAGRLGARVAAAHQIALNLASVTFMMSVGVASATAVRVGKAIGEGGSGSPRRAGLVGAGVGLAIMTLGVVAFVFFPAALAGLFTPEADLAAMAAQLIAIGGLFQLFDGLQAVMAGALRGAGDVQFPFVANLVAHWAIGFPVALFLGFELHLRAPGLWLGLTAGLVVVSIALSVRFARITRGLIARVG